MAPNSREARMGLLQGTLDLLILRTLEAEPRHGWAIAERIQQASGGALAANQGSLYPALHRLEHRGWVKAEWRTSELGRRARYYQLTSAGKRQLARETGQWHSFAAAIGSVLEKA